VWEKCEMKICRKCKHLQHWSRFDKDKSRKDGYASWCKACRSENRRIPGYEIRNFQHAVLENTQRRYCSDCKEIKNITEFYKCKNGRWGVDNLCKLCAKIRAQKRAAMKTLATV